jgi:hypothetical protein
MTVYHIIVVYIVYHSMNPYTYLETTCNIIISEWSVVVVVTEVRLVDKSSYLVSILLGSQVGVVMGYKLYTANFKDRIGLGSGSILIHFWTNII